MSETTAVALPNEEIPTIRVVVLTEACTLGDVDEVVEVPQDDATNALVAAGHVRPTTKPAGKAKAAKKAAAKKAAAGGGKDS